MIAVKQLTRDERTDALVALAKQLVSSVSVDAHSCEPVTLATVTLSDRLAAAIGAWEHCEFGPGGDARSPF